MRIGYADPPYIGCAGRYPEHTEVDHGDLVQRLDRAYDGWILHAAATPASMAVLAPIVVATGARWCAWVKGFASFKPTVPVAYAWEPVIIKAARTPIVDGRMVMRDWIQEPITLQRGMIGAKPERVCQWAFALVGAEEGDELVDLYPGSGAVTRAWETWRRQLLLALE
jgi:hypothetical protein